MRAFCIILVSIMLAACGQSDSFTVTADIESLGVETLTLSYFSHGHLQQVNAHAPEAGKPVKLTGESADYTLAWLRRANGETVATFTARNGDHIKVTVTENSLPEITGNAPCDSLSIFLADNAQLVRKGHSPRLSEAVERYVTEHPQSVTSALLLVTLFDAAAQPAMADSLYSRLATEVKSPGIVDGWAEQLSLATIDLMTQKIPPLTIYGPADSAITLVATAKPYTLLAFSQGTRPDSVDRGMRDMRKKHSAKRLEMLEITLDGDSAAWNTSFGRDSATWQRGWNPGGPASPALRRLSVPRTPFFIVADSTGTQIYRGPSVSAAATMIKSRIN